MGSRKGTLAAILADQGFGTRKECARLVWNGLVEVGYMKDEEIKWRTPEEPNEQVIPDDLFLRVDDLIIPYRKHLHIAFHKPIDTECSHIPSHHQSVFALLPQAFIARKMESVGRLDADTTGLLLFSDSGPFNHFFTSPKRHIPKTYRVGLKHPISSDQISRLEVGVELKSEEGITLPAKVKILSEKVCDLTLEEGKYHQVKRMFGAVGNRVESIHRIAIGTLKLDETLPVGKWRILTDQDLADLGYTGE